MQVTTTASGARRRPFIAIALAAVLALVGGSLITTPSDAAAKYPYKAPPSVAVANVGKDYAEIVFGTVTGAPTYRIRAEQLDSKGKVVSGKTKTTSTGPEGFWTITGLSPNTKYKFTVAVEQPSPKKLLSAYSTKSATATTNPASYLDAPINLTTRDDPDDELDKNGQRAYSIDLMWLAPAGFDPEKHVFLVEYATDRVMKTAKGSYRTPGTLVPKAMLQTMDAPVTELELEEATTEPSPDSTEEPTDPATEAPDESAQPTSEPSTQQPATEQPSQTPEAAPSPTGEATDGDSAEQEATRGPNDVIQLSTPIRPTVANAAAETYWARVPGNGKLTDNTNWYMRVKIISKSNAVLGERGEAVMVKTLSPKGYITGQVNLTDADDAKNYAVAAYSGNDLHDQADLSDDGRYQLSVRPGSYQVVAVYIGSGNFSSRWAATNTTQGRTRTDATRSVSVTAAKETAGVNITPQSQSTYTVSGDIDCPGAATTQCTVDVAAMSTWGTSRVVTQVRSDSSGVYTLRGLPAGQYRLRISHADLRYKVKQITVTIGGGNLTGIDGDLDERAWVKKYPAKIKKTGKTVKVTSKAWIASELPVVRGVQKCQWQRNKVNIPGATSCTYKLKAADKGKSIRVRIKQDRYGFVDNTTYSKAVKG